MRSVKQKIRPDAAFPKLMKQIGVAPDNSAFNTRAEKYAHNAVQLAAIRARIKRAREKVDAR